MLNVEEYAERVINAGFRDTVLGNLHVNVRLNTRATKVSPQLIRSMRNYELRTGRRIAKYLRRTARRLIKPRRSGRGKAVKAANPHGIPSAPYQPPRIPLYRKGDSPLRTLMRYGSEDYGGLDSFAGTRFYIGPAKFRPSPNLHIKPTGSKTIAAVTERGGTQTYKTTGKALLYRPRPFMAKALSEAMKRPGFQNLIRDVTFY